MALLGRYDGNDRATEAKILQLVGSLCAAPSRYALVPIQSSRDALVKCVPCGTSLPRDSGEQRTAIAGSPPPGPLRPPIRTHKGLDVGEESGRQAPQPV